MSSRGLPLVFLALAACGNDPPAETPKAPKPEDKTEVSMQAVAIPDAAAPEPVATAPATMATSPTDPAEDPNIGGPQDAAVEPSVAPIRPRLRACYKKAILTTPGISGSVTFDTTVGKDGKVSAARFVKKEGLNDDMVNCINSAVKSMTFPPDRKTQVVAFIFGKTSAAPSTGAPSADAGARH